MVNGVGQVGDPLAYWCVHAMVDPLQVQSKRLMTQETANEKKNSVSKQSNMEYSCQVTSNW